MLLAVDPGLRGCGCALFENNLLKAAAYVQGEKDPKAKLHDLWSVMANRVVEWLGPDWLSPTVALTIELPQVYQGKKQKGDPNDLINLAAVVGAISRNFHTRVYLPAEWKGQVPKEIMHDRARKRLSESELACVELPRAKGLHHNTWDAVALGLTHLKRL